MMKTNNALAIKREHDASVLTVSNSTLIVFNFRMLKPEVENN